jgi:hypothetical protein
MRWTVLVVAAGWLASARLVEAQPRPLRVAIVPSVTVNLDAARVDAITADLAESLTAELEITAVGGLEVRRQLPPEGVPPECVTTPSCAADVAKRLDANQILFLVIVGSGNGLQVDSTWVEPSTGHSASRAPIDVANMNDARIRFAAVAHQLLPDATVRKKPVAPTGGGGGIGVMSKEVPKHFTTASYVTSAVGVAGLGVGIALGLSTRSKYNDCDASRTCTQSTRDSIRLTGLVADAGYLVAIGGAVATSILFATSGESAHLIVAPTAEASGGISGVTIGAFGRF